MGSGYASWSIFMYMLLVMCPHGYGAREMNAMKHPTNDDIPKGTSIFRLHSMDANDKDRYHAMDDHIRIHDEHDDDAHISHVHGHSSSHMDHMDPSLMVFFFMEDLKMAKRMPIYFPKRDPSSSPQFLPRQEADLIPFSLEKLRNLIEIFSFSQGSPQAKAMEDTLRQCETKPIKGESKFCATSLESMLDFTRFIFGLDTQFLVLSTTHLTESPTLLQNYTVLQNPQEILAPKMVACHTMPYPYAIFYCHYQKSESKVYKVFLGGENGERVEAVAVCHMDTSQWSPDHVSFRVLGIKPGSLPVCHFFPSDNLVWVPLPSYIAV